MKRFAATALVLALAAALAAPSLLSGAEPLPAPEKIVLKNGITVYFLSDRSVPLVSFRMLVRGAGSAFDPAGLEGTAGLTASLVTKGTAKMSADEIAEALDFMGASLSVSAADEFAQVGGRSLAEFFPRLMAIAADCLSGPAFSEDEFAKERSKRIDSLKAAKDNPGIAVRYYFQKAYFGGHPFGNLAMGTEASLEKMTAASVKKFYAERFRPDLAVAAVVGGITKEELTPLLEATLGSWANPAGGPQPDTVPPLPVPKGRDLLLVDKPDATQAYFVIGSPGYPMGAPITPDAAVMNTLWGGRFTSWFNTELRIKRGLTYGARSSFESWAAGGVFTATSYTKNDKIGEMLDITFDLLDKAAKKGFTAEEVESARNYILGQFPPTLETNASKAAAYARLAFYKLGFDYYGKYLADIEKVTLEGVDKAAARLMPEKNFVLVVVGKASDVMPQLKKFGTWKERKITAPGF
jgi:zinc protease